MGGRWEGGELLEHTRQQKRSGTQSGWREWQSTHENNEEQSTEDLGGPVKLFRDTIMVATCQTFVQTHRVHNAVSEP